MRACTKNKPYKFTWIVILINNDFTTDYASIWCSAVHKCMYLMLPSPRIVLNVWINDKPQHLKLVCQIQEEVVKQLKQETCQSHTFSITQITRNYLILHEDTDSRPKTIFSWSFSVNINIRDPFMSKDQQCRPYVIPPPTPKVFHELTFGCEA